MARVVVRTAQVVCIHQFNLVITGLPAKTQLTIDSSPTLTTTSTGPVTGCTNPANSGGPCTTLSSWQNPSMLLAVGGESAILDSSIPVTDKGSGMVRQAGQTKLDVMR
jgi:hypothetical protein